MYHSIPLSPTPKYRWTIDSVIVWSITNYSQVTAVGRFSSFVTPCFSFKVNKRTLTNRSGSGIIPRVCAAGSLLSSLQITIKILFSTNMWKWINIKTPEKILTHQVSLLVPDVGADVGADVRLRVKGTQVAPPLQTCRKTKILLTEQICILTVCHLKFLEVFLCKVRHLFCRFLPVLALKYDESASSRETERPMSTEGSHSSPRVSWVGEDGGGGGWWTGEGGSEEEEAGEEFMVRFDLNRFVSNRSNRLIQVRDVGLPLGWFEDSGRSTFCFSAVPSSSKRLSEGQPESVAWDRMQSSSNTWRKRMGRRKRIFMSAGVWLMCMFLKLDFRLYHSTQLLEYSCQTTTLSP